MKTFTYDIIGCGATVQLNHVPVLQYLQSNGNVNVRGCFDMNIGNAKKVGNLLNATVYGTPQDISNQSVVDCVAIATPPDSHFEIAKRCLLSGCNVFMEKPFVVTREQANELTAEAKKNYLNIMVGHLRRLYPGVRIAKQFISSGGIGTITRIEAFEGGRWDWAAASNYAFENEAGGVIFDTGSHLIDMILFMLSIDNMEEKVAYKIETISKYPEHEPSQECSVKLQLIKGANDKIDLKIKLSRLEAYPSFVKFYGTHGILLLPTSFSLSPVLIKNKAQFLLNDAGLGVVPKDIKTCFLMMHEEVVKFIGKERQTSVFEASNFVLLTSILESLTFGDSQETI